jgi:hypothetical protein
VVSASSKYLGIENRRQEAHTVIGVQPIPIVPCYVINNTADKMRRIAIAAQILACVVLAGCGLDQAYRIDGVITDYHRLSPQAHIGDSKVMEFLDPCRSVSTQPKEASKLTTDGAS